MRVLRNCSLHSGNRYFCDEHLTTLIKRTSAADRAIESHGLHVAEIHIWLHPLMFLKEFANRGRQPVNCHQMSRDETEPFGSRNHPCNTRRGLPYEY